MNRSALIFATNKQACAQNQNIHPNFPKPDFLFGGLPGTALFGPGIGKNVDIGGCRGGAPDRPRWFEEKIGTEQTSFQINAPDSGQFPTQE